MHPRSPARSGVPYISAEEIVGLLAPADAIRALQTELRSGLDPAADPPRGSFTTRHGEMLLMPAEAGASVGIKIVNVAPGNGRLSVPRIHGIYALFDAETLRPQALMDGAALTSLRTPAVSFAAISSALETRGGPLRVVIFGTGPQGIAHLGALLSLVGEGGLEQVVFVSRRESAVPPESTSGIVCRTTSSGSAGARLELARADLIICATGSAEPVFDSAIISGRPLIVAVGSHEPDRRELDGSLIGRAQVIVEDVPTALREAGDVAMAVKEGTLDPGVLIAMKDIVTERVPVASDRPVVFKSTGMSWEDLALAKRIYAEWRHGLAR